MSRAKSKIKTGDTVKIVNTGSYYPTHEDAARELGAINWQPNVCPDNGTLGKVISYWRENEYCEFFLVDFVYCQVVFEPTGIVTVSSDWDTENNLK